MTLDHALRLLAMLTDTVTSLQQQIDALNQQLLEAREGSCPPAS